MDTGTLNYLLALGTVLLQLVTLLLIVLFLMRPSGVLGDLMRMLREWGLWLGLAVSLGASAMTLVYSEIIGYPPCPLCWWQRIFLYPQVVLFAIALRTKDAAVTTYSIALSILGLGFALYHHALQVLPSGSLPCPAQGTVSCGQRFIFEFGYVTFPMMAAALFAFLIVLMLIVRRRV